MLVMGLASGIEPQNYATAAWSTTYILTGFLIKINWAAEYDSATTGLLPNCSYGTMDYLNGSMTEPIQLDCAGYCPPYRPTDSSVYYCWKNCEDYMKCVLKRVKNGDDVMYDLQQRANRPNSSCPSNTWFYHILRGFVSCRFVCNSTRKDLKFCQVNCPDLYKCLGLRFNRTSTTANLPQFQSPLSEFNLRTSATPTLSTSDDRQPWMQMNTMIAMTAPTAHLNISVSSTESEGNYSTDSQSQEGHVKLLIALPTAAAVSLPLIIVLLILIVLHRRRRSRATHALQVLAQQNVMNHDADNHDHPDDNYSSTRTQTSRNSFHGDQETQPPAERHPLTASKLPCHQSIDDASEEETAAKTPLITTNNERSRPQTLYPFLSGSFEFKSEDCSQATLATEADNEKSEELHARLQLDNILY